MASRKKADHEAARSRLGFLSYVEVMRSRVRNVASYPFSIAAIAALPDRLLLDPKVTFFVGENGSGKSTLLEAIAVAAGFNPEGGSRNFQFSTRQSVSELHSCFRLVRTERRPRTGFFLRAESFFNLATNIEELDREPVDALPIIESYGGRSLHEQSHGESFLALVENRFGPNGLYILDEPEAALSPSRQLILLKHLYLLAQDGSQFIIATHSPILMSLPHARMYLLSERGIDSIRYEETEHYQVSRKFFLDRERFLKEILTSE